MLFEHIVVDTGPALVVMQVFLGLLEVVDVLLFVVQVAVRVVDLEHFFEGFVAEGVGEVVRVGVNVFGGGLGEVVGFGFSGFRVGLQGQKLVLICGMKSMVSFKLSGTFFKSLDLNGVLSFAI